MTCLTKWFSTSLTFVCRVLRLQYLFQCPFYIGPLGKALWRATLNTFVSVYLPRYSYAPCRRKPLMDSYKSWYLFTRTFVFSAQVMYSFHRVTIVNNLVKEANIIFVWFTFIFRYFGKQKEKTQTVFQSQFSLDRLPGKLIRQNATAKETKYLSFFS